MEWVNIEESGPPIAGTYIVRTKSNLRNSTLTNALRLKLTYDGKGSPHWHCFNQIVTHYLNESGYNGDKVLCAAIYFDDGKKHSHQPNNIGSGFVVAGRRHHNCFATMSAIYKGTTTVPFQKPSFLLETQGFITTQNLFVTREEALFIAAKAGQLRTDEPIRGERLYSENLY